MVGVVVGDEDGGELVNGGGLDPFDYSIGVWDQEGRVGECAVCVAYDERGDTGEAFLTGGLGVGLQSFSSHDVLSSEILVSADSFLSAMCRNNSNGILPVQLPKFVSSCSR